MIKNALNVQQRLMRHTEYNESSGCWEWFGSKRTSKIVGGNPENGRRKNDFYPTPPEATVALLDFLNLPQGTKVWEPACGEGDIWNNANEQVSYRAFGYGTRGYPTWFKCYCKECGAIGATAHIEKECQNNTTYERWAKEQAIEAWNRRIGNEA